MEAIFLDANNRWPIWVPTNCGYSDGPCEPGVAAHPDCCVCAKTVRPCQHCADPASTPEAIAVEMAGIVNDPAGLFDCVQFNGNYELKQRDTESPCNWYFYSEDWDPDIRFMELSVQLGYDPSDDTHAFNVTMLVGYGPGLDSCSMSWNTGLTLGKPDCTFPTDRPALPQNSNCTFCDITGSNATIRAAV